MNKSKGILIKSMWNLHVLPSYSLRQGLIPTATRRKLSGDIRSPLFFSWPLSQATLTPVLTQSSALLETFKACAIIQDCRSVGEVLASREWSLWVMDDSLLWFKFSPHRQRLQRRSPFLSYQDSWPGPILVSWKSLSVILDELSVAERGRENLPLF